MILLLPSLWYLLRPIYVASFITWSSFLASSFFRRYWACGWFINSFIEVLVIVTAPIAVGTCVPANLALASFCKRFRYFLFLSSQRFCMSAICWGVRALCRACARSVNTSISLLPCCTCGLAPLPKLRTSMPCLFTCFSMLSYRPRKSTELVPLVAG